MDILSDTKSYYFELYDSDDNTGDVHEIIDAHYKATFYSALIALISVIFTTFAAFMSSMLLRPNRYQQV